MLHLLSSHVCAQADPSSMLTQPGHAVCQLSLGRALPQWTYQAIAAPRVSLTAVSERDPDSELLTQCPGSLSDEGITLPALHSPPAPGSLPVGRRQTLILPNSRLRKEN